MYPDLEFLPRAPDPEEIIIGDETDDVDENVPPKDTDTQSENQETKEEQIEIKADVRKDESEGEEKM